MTAPSVAPAYRDDQILPLTRGVAYAIVPFLLVGFAVLYPWPGDTGRVFAWPIRPSMTAMTLGSAYLGGAYYFVRTAQVRAWHTVKAGLPPVAIFASLLGIATLLHWDRFAHRHLAFWLWALLYFTTPFLIGWAWLRNRTRDAPATDRDLLLPVVATRAIAVAGGLAGVTGAFLVLLPDTARSVWPWQLTPLTAQVLGAIFCLGLAGLGTLVDRRWSSARIPIQVAAIMLTLILVAGVRAHAQFAPGNPLTWLLAAGFGAALAGLGVLYQRMQRASEERP